MENNIIYKRGKSYLFEEFDGQKNRLIEMKILDFSVSKKHVKVQYGHTNFITWLTAEQFDKYVFIEQLRKSREAR